MVQTIAFVNEELPAYETTSAFLCVHLMQSFLWRGSFKIRQSNIAAFSSEIRPKMRTLLLLDWDGTLTTSSTLTHIARISHHVPDHVLQPYTEDYIEDYSRHAQIYRPSKSERKTLEDELAYLDSLCSVEAASIRRLEQGKIWEGLSRADVDAAGRSTQQYPNGANNAVQLRKGTKELVQRVWEQEGKVGIVSVSWSATWITAVLKSKGLEAQAVETQSEGLKAIFVCANEIDSNGTGMLSRGLPLSKESLRFDGVGEGLWTATHKRQVVKNIVERIAQQQDQWLVVYVGDSPTDLGCLVEANVGVCIRDEQMSGEQKSLQDALQRIGYSCRSIEKLDIENKAADCSTDQLWWVTDFEAIKNALELV